MTAIEAISAQPDQPTQPIQPVQSTQTAQLAQNELFDTQTVKIKLAWSPSNFRKLMIFWSFSDFSLEIPRVFPT